LQSPIVIFRRALIELCSEGRFPGLCIAGCCVAPRSPPRDLTRAAIRTGTTTSIGRASVTSGLGRESIPRSQVVVRPANLPELRSLHAGMHSCGHSAHSIKESGHANESNFPELCASAWLRNHPSERRVFARVSRNVGTAKGLHARRLAAMQLANPRCGQDRGLLTAKCSATQRSVPRGLCTARCAFTWRGSRVRAKTLRSTLWATALRSRLWAKTLRQGLWATALLRSKALLWSSTLRLLRRIR
jgi:hypothetical protein